MLELLWHIGWFWRGKGALVGRIWWQGRDEGSRRDEEEREEGVDFGGYDGGKYMVWERLAKTWNSEMKFVMVEVLL